AGEGGQVGGGVASASIGGEVIGAERVHDRENDRRRPTGGGSQRNKLGFGDDSEHRRIGEEGIGAAAVRSLDGALDAQEQALTPPSRQVGAHGSPPLGPLPAPSEGEIGEEAFVPSGVPQKKSRAHPHGRALPRPPQKADGGLQHAVFARIERQLEGGRGRDDGTADVLQDPHGLDGRKNGGAGRGGSSASRRLPHREISRAEGSRGRIPPSRGFQFED